MIVAGFGFRATARKESLLDALAKLGPVRIDALATHAAKAEAHAMRDAAAHLGLPLHKVSPEAMEDVETRTHSQAAQDAYGTGSVAEAAALAAAGRGARLIRARVISDDRLATCALAEGEGA